MTATPLTEVRRWLKNEPVFRVELNRSHGQVTRINYVEAVDERDARAIFANLPVTVLDVRRARPSDAAEARNL